MHVIGVELLKNKRDTLKFILNDRGIVFFPATQQHRDIKMPGLSYEDDDRGNALAGLVTPERVEIRFHGAFSDERVRGLWSRVLAISEIAHAGLGRVHYHLNPAHLEGRKAHFDPIKGSVLLLTTFPSTLNPPLDVDGNHAFTSKYQDRL